ncbi:MAG TPA: hypothetical protein PK813_11275 [Candidatus Hydrogenedens sp.]|nr:hypothetical protein [Candidatus Hydrogenedens sp.]
MSTFANIQKEYRYINLIIVFIILLSIYYLFFIVPPAQAVIYIDTIEKLQKIGKDPNYPLNGEYILTQDIDATATRNWNGGTGFEPIGDANAFTGKFNGNNKKIIGLYINTNNPAGGLVGLFAGIAEGGEVYNLGLENIDITEGSMYDVFIGGLAGINAGTITQCYSTGTVDSYGGGREEAGTFVGGLTGINFGTITQCYSTGTVDSYGGGKEEDFVGGLTGINFGTITQCHFKGTVNSSGGGPVTGGLIGINFGTITRCYSIGTVSSSGEFLLAGGLIGGNGGVLTLCYSSGSVSVSGITFASVGGLVGFNSISDEDSASQNCIISECYSTSFVNGEVSPGSEGDSGLLGGGLVGYNASTIQRCYSIGQVKGTGAQGASIQLGGLVGYNEGGTITSSYWNKTTSGLNTSDGGIGKTTNEMKQKATYVGWDFNNVWTIDDGQSYPYLRSLGPTQGIIDTIEEGNKEGMEGEGTVGEGNKEENKEGNKDLPEEPETNSCGCSSKSLKSNYWWKYLLDIFFFSLIISLISGMRKQEQMK